MVEKEHAVRPNNVPIKTPFDHLRTDINGYTLADAYRIGYERGREEEKKSKRQLEESGSRDQVEKEVM